MKNANTLETQTHATKPNAPLKGTVRAPGDKSISHRALIFGALAEGTTTIQGLLEGDDILQTAGAMRAFGAEITQKSQGKWIVKGCGKRGFTTPKAPVDFGNAGTGARLVMGAASAFNITVDYIGDESLSVRPMGRVLDPLTQMGAKFTSTNSTLPLSQTKGGNLKPFSFTPPHASAQVKSALILAGLKTRGTTEVIETSITRDHTENMLEAFGVPVTRKSIDTGSSVSIKGPVLLKATNVTVPGDPSSAAFLIAAALVVPGSDIIVENIMMNASRTGLFEVLTEMGAFLRADNFRKSGGEIIADIHVKYSKLVGVTVPEDRVPSMVDEYPILAVIAAYAKGTTEMRGLAELRVKESDRLVATHALLSQNGVATKIKGDNLLVTGGVLPSGIKGGACVTTHHDHRIAMSALVLGLGTKNPVSIDDAAMIATSFPDFFDLMSSIGAPITMPKPH
ncbi:MAG: 3-phosphoshikimate 1-carboxyvinyltransferase [Robiginitomaculum sp.]|nr:MAG: 3-phosphoshikimate 1-carboxyvinyltransferase [Robiginitomaculum sp.]